MKTTAPIVAMRGVSKTYGGSAPVRAVADVDLNIRLGEYVAIMGPSGSGKSTLLNLIGCLDRPSAGEYLFDGMDVGGLPERERSRIRAVSIGFVFQSFHLIPHRSAAENVDMGLMYTGDPPADRSDKVISAIRAVGLESRLDFPPSNLSGGEKQRVAIARAIAREPRILLCDEPTGNLDSQSTEAILDLFEDLRTRSDLTLVVVTHDPLVSQRASRHIEMLDGETNEGRE